MNVYDPRSFFFQRYLSSSERAGLKRNSNPDLCDAGAVLYQLSYQANWELVVMWVDDKLVDVGYRLTAEIRVRIPVQA